MQEVIGKMTVGEVVHRRVHQCELKLSVKLLMFSVELRKYSESPSALDALILHR